MQPPHHSGYSPDRLAAERDLGPMASAVLDAELSRLEPGQPGLVEQRPPMARQRAILTAL